MLGVKARNESSKRNVQPHLRGVKGADGEAGAQPMINVRRYFL
jgi:hypothetical protein